MQESPRPMSVSVARWLMSLPAAAWASIGLLILLGAHPAMHLSAPWSLLMPGLMLAASLGVLGLVRALGRPNRLAFYATLAFLVLSSIAVLFDQVGWADLIFVAFNVIPVILLLNARLWYLRH